MSGWPRTWKRSIAQTEAEAPNRNRQPEQPATKTRLLYFDFGALQDPQRAAPKGVVMRIRKRSPDGGRPLPDRARQGGTEALFQSCYVGPGECSMGEALKARRGW